jgi:TRAP-type transport system small permease protein
MRKFLNFIFDLFEVYLGVIIFSVLITSVFIQVFMRYVLNMPSPELFEISIYSFVWVIYLGGALAVRYDQHIRFDLLYRMIPRRWRMALEIVFNLFTNVVLLILLAPCVAYTFQVYSIKASALRIPWTFLLIVYPIFIVLVLIHNFIAIGYDVRELRGGGEKPKEDFPWT